MKSIRAVAMLLLCASVASVAAAADTTRYVAIVDGGKNAGHQWVTRDGDTTRVEFIFKDNGRGPELKEEFTLDKQGMFSKYHVTGTSTFGAPVDETFSRSGDNARWKSTSDKGEQPVTGSALYSPLGGTPAMLSVAFAALARSADGKVPMIPSGTLSSRKLLETEVTQGRREAQGAADRAHRRRFHADHAYGPPPASRRACSRSSFPGSLQLIEEGWEKNGAALETQQTDAPRRSCWSAMNERLRASADRRPR